MRLNLFQYNLPHLSQEALLIFLVEPLIKKHSESKLRDQIPLFLDFLILEMQSGRSFRGAFASVVEAQKGWIRFQLREILEMLLNKDRTSELDSNILKEFYHELFEIDRTQVSPLEQVRHYRAQVRSQTFFRQKSRLLTQQVRLQTYLLSAMYIAILLFDLFKYGFYQNQKLFTASIILFLSGSVWILKKGRDVK